MQPSLPPRNPDNAHRPSRQEPREARSSRLTWPDFTGIPQHREALLRIVAMIVATAGIGAGVTSLPRHLHLAALRLLRPAESAARRLIVVLARAMEKSGRTPSPHPMQAFPGGITPSAEPRLPCFPLADPLKRFSLAPRRRFAPGPGPRISVPGYYEPELPAESQPAPDAPVDAAQLCRRIQVLQRALNNLPREARRLMRWQQRQAIRKTPRRILRLGVPPGHRSRPRFEVDAILADCHDLATYALRPPDT